MRPRHIVALLLTGCRRSSFLEFPVGYREFAYVANTAGNTVTVLDLVFLRPDRTLLVGTAPVALAVNPLRDELYVVNAQPAQPAGSLSVIDTATNAVVATIPLRRNPTSIAVDPSGQRAFVVDTGSNSVSVLDLDTRRDIASAPTGDRPTLAVLAPDARTLLVTNQASGSISLYNVVIPAKAAKPSARPEIALRTTFPGCPGASAAVILPDSSKAFVACTDRDQVMALNLAAAPDSWNAKQDPTLLADRVLALLDVGRNPTQLTLKPDGGEIFVSNQTSDSISEISTLNNEVGSTYAIGNRPAHGLVSADNSALWVSNSGADSVSLYSIDDGKFLSSLRTGSAPDALAFSADQHLLLAADTLSGDVAVIRTASKLGPALFTILPAGRSPSAIAIKATQTSP